MSILATVLFWLQEMPGHHHMHQMPGEPDPVNHALSLFNHHFAGWLLAFTAIFGFAENSPLKKYRWVRYLWPMPLIVLAFYLLLRSDHSDLARLSLSDLLSDPEAIQHKFFALLALAIGIIELSLRAGRLKSLAWSYILYTGMVVGSIFLLAHGGHHSDVVHQQHVIMGTTGIAIGVAKALGDLLPRQVWLRAVAVPALFLTLGIELIRYFE